MSNKSTGYMDRYSEEEHLLPLPQQTAPQFHPITQPPQYGQPSVQVPVNAFTGPYQDFAHTGLHQHQPPYQHGSAGQMQQVVVVGQQQQQQPQVVVGRRTYDSYTWHIILSCIVFWCCGWVFGAIAFSLAGQHLTYLHLNIIPPFLPSFHSSVRS